MTVELEYLEVGDGAPVVLMHGLYGSSTNWRNIAKALGDRHRVYSVDLRNHGRSPWVATMSYREMADDVAALIERLGLERPCVVGHSMGGKVAMTLALAEPQRVGRLAVVDIAPVSYGDRLSSYTTAMRGIDTVAATSRGEIQHALLTRIPDEGIVGFLMQNLVRHDEQFDWRINLNALAGAMGDIGGFPAELEGRTFTGPATLINGVRSDYVTDEGRAAFKRCFPAARFVEIADAGHWLHVDQPQAVIDALRDALRDALDG